MTATGFRLAVLLYAVAGVLWAFSGQALEYWAFAVALVELLVAAWVFPASRFQLSAPLSPGNWAVFLFHIHLMVAPLLGITLGFAPGTLPRLPPPSFINLAMLLSAVAHLCFALGAQLAARRPPRATRPPRFSDDFNTALGALFVLLGAAGLVLTFGGLGGFLRYVTDPQTHTQMGEAPATMGGALGTFLRPFFPFGLLLLWSNGVSRRARPGGYVLPTLLLLVGLVVTSANYNRASMVGPVLAALAAYSLIVRRLSARAVALAGLGILLAAVAFGAYRNANLAGPDAPVQARSSQLQETNQFFQVYGEGPQFLGFLLEKTRGEELHLGRSAFASLVYPVPILGKPFRDSSGVHIYNRLIYGTSGIVDQIIPASGELLLNFHLAGVAAFFALLGFLVQRMDQRFRAAATAFSAATTFYVGMWICFPIAGSLAVVSQILIYSLWPLYAYFGLRSVLAACLDPGRPRLEPAGARS